MRILVAEDDAPLAGFLHQRLQEEQFAVQVVSDRREAEKMVSDQCYDLVVLDLNLSGKGGLDVLREIRAKKPDLPVLIVTGASKVEERIRGLDAGADAIASRSHSLLRSWRPASARSCGEGTGQLALFFRLTTWNSIGSTARCAAAIGISN